MYEFVGSDDWENVSLYDVARWKNGLAFNNIEFSEIGLPVVKIAELKNGIAKQTKFTESIYSDEVFIKRGDMLFAWSGSPQTSIDTFIWDGMDGWLNQHIFKVTPADCVNFNYLFFLLKSLRPRFISIALNKQTTGLGHVTVADLKEMRVGVPSLVEQEYIVSIVDPIQQKIDNNRRMNETLEEMAMAIFKSWFVDFDPVHANALGNQPAHMDANTAALFPSTFCDNGLPVGWKYIPAYELFDISIGKTPPRKESHWFSDAAEDIKWASIRDMGVCGYYIMKTSEHLTQKAVQKFNVRVIPKNTVILSFKLTLGRIAITDENMCTNEAIAHFVPKENVEMEPEFLSSYLRQFNFDSLGSTSSIATAVNSKIIKQMPILLTCKHTYSAFQKTAELLFGQIKINLKQNQTLAELRDTLLPKLMSGEIRIADAKREVKAAV